MRGLTRLESRSCLCSYLSRLVPWLLQRDVLKTSIILAATTRLMYVGREKVVRPVSASRRPAGLAALVQTRHQSFNSPYRNKWASAKWKKDSYLQNTTV